MISPPIRILLTVAAWLLSLVVTAVVALGVVIVIAGPHAGILPTWAEVAVLAIGWLVVLVVPLAAAVATWRRLGRRRSRGDAD